MHASTTSVTRWLLSVSLVATLTLAASAPAHADEGEAQRLLPDRTALARIEVARAHFDAALRLLTRVMVSDADKEERAAASEVRAVVERWVALGLVVTPRGAGDPPRGAGPSAVVGGDDWESSFVAARLRLLQGRFDPAAAQLAMLEAGAATRGASLRAQALARLSRELGDRDLVLRAERPAAADPGPAAPVVPATVVAKGAGLVRVHMHSKPRDGAVLYALASWSKYELVCATLPCTVDVPIGARLRVVRASYPSEGHDFRVPGDVGDEVNLQVVAPSRAGSFIMMAVAPPGFLLGFVIFRDYWIVPGIAAGALEVGGLLGLLLGSHEPRVVGPPHGPDLDKFYSREGTLSSDVAVTKRQEPRPVPGSALTPLRLGFTF